MKTEEHYDEYDEGHEHSDGDDADKTRDAESGHGLAKPLPNSSSAVLRTKLGLPNQTARLQWW